jgi:hypothetical protein
MRILSLLPIAVALAIIAVGPSSPAAARNNICASKHIDCKERCIMRADDGGACIARTCDRQFRNCMSDAAGGSDRTGTGAKGKGGGKTGPIVRDKRTPRRGTSSSPLTQPAPVQPRPVSTGTKSPTTGGRPAIRDHRTVRTEPRRGRPSGVSVAKPVRQR